MYTVDTQQYHEGPLLQVTEDPRYSATHRVDETLGVKRSLPDL